MARQRKGLPVNGWLIFDKPQGMTSTQAVTRVKRLYQAAKAGHAGTLDPLATGVLPIALGEATKTVPFVVEGSQGIPLHRPLRRRDRHRRCRGQGGGDERASARLGAEIEAKLADFTGEIEQVPPRYSALKVDGARAYELARDEEDFELAARRVSIESLTLVDHPDQDRCVLETHCGKGTYVRSLARDLGRALGALGHVEALRRTRVGAVRARTRAVTLASARGAGRERRPRGAAERARAGRDGALRHPGACRRRA